MPELSAVICTVGRPDLIAGAVESVLKGTLEDIELLVVDQSPDTSTRDALSPFAGDQRLRYMHTDRVGLSAAYNSGIREASADLVAFTDDDCVAAPDWAAAIREAFSQNPDVDLMYGQVLGPGAPPVAAGVIPTLEFETRRTLSERDGFEVFGMGANFAARRAFVLSIGGFDEVLGGGGPLRSSQDFDLQFRTFRAGGTCLLEPAVRVTHYGFRADAVWPNTLLAYGVGDGAFYMKHVRCGDGLALRIVAGRLMHETARAVIKPLMRRPHSRAYLMGMLSGLRGSFRYPVDRSRRIYSTPAHEEH